VIKKINMIEDEICNQTGLMSVLIYLQENDGCNQKTLINNTKASTITIYRIQNILLKYNLITMKKSDVYNQNLYYLTERGKKLAKMFVEIRQLLL
jgi:hypothetical protein